MDSQMYMDPRTYQDKVNEEIELVLTKYVTEYSPSEDGFSFSKDKPISYYPETVKFLIEKGIIDMIDDQRSIAAFDWSNIQLWYKIIVSKEILYCNGLTFNIATGETNFGKVKLNPKPTSQRYKLLRLLLENKNRLVTYEEILKKVFDDWVDKLTKGDQERIYELVKDLKRILKIPKENKNIFRGNGGYMIFDSENLP